MAPPWLIHDPDLAYRAALAWGSLWFSCAAIPAWFLARRVGVSDGGALVVAAAAVFLPDGVLTTMLLSEPFAYPLFLLTACVATATLAAPTSRRQVVLAASMAALALVRFQFVALPVVYLVAALVYHGFRPRAVLRSQPLFVLGGAACGAAALAVGLDRLVGAYAALGAARLSWGIVPWVLVNLFVLLLAVGWVVAPGAALGFRALLVEHGVERAFAAYATLAAVALLLEAAVFGQREGAVLERYVFYAAPFVVIAFLRRADPVRTRAYVVVGYSLAALAFLLPLVTTYATTVSAQSPTLLALDWIAGGGAIGRSLAAVGCGLLAAGLALGLGRRRTIVVTASVLVLLLTVAGTRAMFAVRHDPASAGVRAREIRTYAAPAGSALLVTRTTPPTQIMNTLFWNPGVSRVLVLGGGGSSDGFVSSAYRRPSSAGPFLLAPDAVGFDGSGAMTPRVLRAQPPVLIFGWDPADSYLDTTSFLFVVAERAALRVRLTLTSSDSGKIVALSCGAARKRVDVGRRSVALLIDVSRAATAYCRIALVGGRPEAWGPRVVGVRAAIRVTRRGVSSRAGVPLRVSLATARGS